MIKTVISICVAVFLLGCQQQTQPRKYQLHEYAFGSYVDVTFFTNQASTAEKIQQKVQAKIQWMHQQWHAWAPSQLSKIHQACQTRQTVNLDQDMITLLQKAQVIYQKSNGLFNAAAGEIIKLWGFHSDTPERKRSPPTPENITSTLATLGKMSDISIHENSIECSNPHVLLDFGGFGKGYAAEKILQLLKEEHVQQAVINLGGDLITLGTNSDKPWTIALENPFAKTPLAVIHAQDQAIFSSGTYRRRFKYHNKSYHHIINPVTGYPSTELIAVTVVAKDATLADAGATSILIAGPEHWLELARKFELQEVLMIKPDRTLLATPKMMRSIQPTKSIKLEKLPRI